MPTSTGKWTRCIYSICLTRRVQHMFNRIFTKNIRKNIRRDIQKYSHSFTLWSFSIFTFILYVLCTQVLLSFETPLPTQFLLSLETSQIWVSQSYTRRFSTDSSVFHSALSLSLLLLFAFLHFPTLLNLLCCLLYILHIIVLFISKVTVIHNCIQRLYSDNKFSCTWAEITA